MKAAPPQGFQVALKGRNRTRQMAEMPAIIDVGNRVVRHDWDGHSLIVSDADDTIKRHGGDRSFQARNRTAQ